MYLTMDLIMDLVWGPEPIRLGFIGAPIATAISFNLISLMSLAYAIFFVHPKTAWCPITRDIFKNLGVLFRLGVAGVGTISLNPVSSSPSISHWSAFRSNCFRLVGMGACCFSRESVSTSLPGIHVAVTLKPYPSSIRLGSTALATQSM